MGHFWLDALPYVLGSVSGGGFIGVVCKGLQDYRAGRIQVEERRNASLLQQRDTAVAERDAQRDMTVVERDRADAEAKARRVLEEAYALLRRECITRWQVPEQELPLWPEY